MACTTDIFQDDNGKFNFDQEKVINPETGEQVSWARFQLSVLLGERLTAWLDLPGVQLVSWQRNLGQQILHHRVLLWRMPRWVCGTIPVSQQGSAQVGCTINMQFLGEFSTIYRR